MTNSAIPEIDIFPIERSDDIPYRLSVWQGNLRREKMLRDMEEYYRKMDETKEK